MLNKTIGEIETMNELEKEQYYVLLCDTLYNIKLQRYNIKNQLKIMKKFINKQYNYHED
jgi:hypothetical protein